MISAAKRILLVDDEPQLIRVLSPSLAAAGFEVKTACTGDEALAALAQSESDVVLLDLGLPDMDGKEVIARARSWSEAPIIVLSARELEAEKVAALDIGADDFVNKPFSMGELLARIRAALRGRERRFRSSAKIETGELQIDLELRKVTVSGQDVRLTPREFDLLATLAQFCGKVVTHKQLMAAVWREGAVSDPQFVRVLVGQVRQKIEEDPSLPRLLLTEPGAGYRLADRPAGDVDVDPAEEGRSCPA